MYLTLALTSTSFHTNGGIDKIIANICTYCHSIYSVWSLISWEYSVPLSQKWPISEKKSSLTLRGREAFVFLLAVHLHSLVGDSLLQKVIHETNLSYMWPYSSPDPVHIPTHCISNSVRWLVSCARQAVTGAALVPACSQYIDWQVQRRNVQSGAFDEPLV